jgi:UDP-N-acetyl-2-amino-2-deoxyglucuronate dehydrogenase
MFSIQFENGASGLFFATVANYGDSSVELQVIFENGKFTIKDSILTRLNESEKKEEMIEDQKLPGAKLINQFYSCIINNDTNYVHVRDALTSLEIIESICESSKLQKEVKMKKFAYAVK